MVLCMQDCFPLFILCMAVLPCLSIATNVGSPYFDVMNYGAIGDGRTDDSQVTSVSLYVDIENLARILNLLFD